LRNPFRKIRVETISISPQFKKYDSNFIETRKYETRWIYEYGGEILIEWGLKLNPLAWLLLGSVILYFKLKGLNWREELKK